MKQLLFISALLLVASVSTVQAFCTNNPNITDWSKYDIACWHMLNHDTVTMGYVNGGSVGGLETFHKYTFNAWIRGIGSTPTIQACTMRSDKVPDEGCFGEFNAGSWASVFHQESKGRYVRCFHRHGISDAETDNWYNSQPYC